LQSEIVPPEIESLKPRPPVWEAWPTIGFGVAIFAVYFVAQSLVTVIFAIRQWAANPELDPFASIMSLSTNGLLISMATIASAIVGVGFIILFIKFRKGITIAEYLGLKTLNKKTALILLAVVVGLILLSSGLNQFMQKPQDAGFTVDAYKTSVWPASLWIATVIFAPAFEESFFRGFVFVGLKQSRIGPVGAIVLTALAWALLHIQYDLYGMVTILVLGIVFGIVRLRTGSLWSTLFLHSLWNLAAMIGTMLYVNGIGR
jgi:membrane protease YdiL (CAAX protease family)